jgi:restriction system protein
MSPGGSQSEWQRRQAAQRREDERRKREQANQAKEEERRRKQEHLAFQQRKAEEKTAAVEGQVRVLEGLLADSLSRLPLTFQQLKMSLNIPGFDPGPLGIPRPEPKWADHAPVEPGA